MSVKEKRGVDRKIKPWNRVTSTVSTATAKTSTAITTTTTITTASTTTPSSPVLPTRTTTTTEQRRGLKKLARQKVAIFQQTAANFHRGDYECSNC